MSHAVFRKVGKTPSNPTKHALQFKNDITILKQYLPQILALLKKVDRDTNDTKENVTVIKKIINTQLASPNTSSATTRFRYITAAAAPAPPTQASFSSSFLNITNTTTSPDATQATGTKLSTQANRAVTVKIKSRDQVKLLRQHNTSGYLLKCTRNVLCKTGSASINKSDC
ncbi:hypothetical protein B7494_g8457 [Chlorociboria aeruginascens]|nr:hypothetical protein B7494_g8457 [Chlorociboria aeruginascens]